MRQVGDTGLGDGCGYRAKHWAWLLLALMPLSCGRARPPKPLAMSPNRVAKADLVGRDFYFLKTLIEIQNPGEEQRELPRGLYLVKNHVVQFVPRDQQLDVVIKKAPVEPGEEGSKEGAVIATFPAENVSIERKRNSDNQPTPEEEIGGADKPPSQRPFMVVDWPQDKLDKFRADTVTSSLVDEPAWNPRTGTLYFSVEQKLKNGTRIVLSYCFKPRTENDYPKFAYSAYEQSRFGFFKSTTEDPSSTGYSLERAKHDWLNRWHPRHHLKYQIAADFPEPMRASAIEALRLWDERMKLAMGRRFIQWEATPSSRLGDLDTNVFFLDRSRGTDHRVLGYGPLFADPETGQVIKSDVFLYEFEAQRAIARDEWSMGFIYGREGDPTRVPDITLNDLMRQLNTLAPILHACRGSAEDCRPSGPGAGSPPETHTDYTPDDFLRKAAMEYSDSQKALEHVRSRFFRDHSRQITRSSEAFSVAWAERWRLQRPSFEEKLRQVALSLAVHEVGHNLGLRHNFKGSADPAAGDNKVSTTVMDYGASLAHDAPEPGVYDEDALKFAYGPEMQSRNPVLEKNYYYCTDEDALDPVDALCSPYDSGRTLTSAAIDQLNREQRGYPWNNLRGERNGFGKGSSSLEEYQSRVVSVLLPLRLIFNNAVAISSAFLDDPLRRELVKPYPLWLAAKERILADANSDPKDVETWDIPLESQGSNRGSGQTLPHERVLRLRVDLKRIDKVRDDALQAKWVAFAALKAVVLQEGVPDYDQYDPGDRKLLVRGVLFNKMAALGLLLTRMKHPSLPRLPFSPFASFQQELPVQLLVGILADTRARYSAKTDDKELERRFASLPSFDVNLRHHSLSLLSSQLLTLGPGAELKSLLAFQKFRAPSELVTKLLETRILLKQTQAVLRKWNEGEGKDVPEENEPPRIRRARANDLTYRSSIRSLESRIPYEVMTEIDGWMEAVQDTRDQIRSRYYRLALTTYLDPRNRAVRERLWGEIEKLKSARLDSSKAHTFLAPDVMIKASCDSRFDRTETATCGLIRGSINDLEDRVYAMNLLRRQLQLRIQQLQRTTPPAENEEELPNWLPATLTSARDVETRVQEGIQEYSNQLANEKMLLEEMLRVAGNW